MSGIYQTSSYLLLQPVYYVGSSIRHAFGFQSSTPPLDRQHPVALGGSGLQINPASSLSKGSREHEPNETVETEEEEMLKMRRALERAMRSFRSEDSEFENRCARGEAVEGTHKETAEELRRGTEEEKERTDNVSAELSIDLGQPTPSTHSRMESSHVDPIPVYQEAEAIPSAVDSSSILIQSLPPLTLPTTPLHDSNNSELQTPVRPSPTDMDTLKRRSLDLSHSLNRLSRRATVCLSTLTALQPAFSSSTDDQAEVDGMREVAIGGEREAALIEEVLEDELKIVEKEVEEFVEGVVAAERAEDQEREEAMTKLGAEQKEGKEVEWSWFRDQKGYKNFHQVEWTVERGTNAEDFCLACEGMIRLAEYLTPSLAGLCTNEIGNELKKIRTRTTVENVTTLEEIILVEKNSRRKIATDAINWLLLMLKFGTRAYGMNLDSTEKEELSISFTRAWDQEYCKYFNFLVRPLFKILIKACPSRQTFYSKLGTPVRVAEEDFGEWLGGIEIVAERLEAWEESEKEKEKEKRVEQRKGKK